MMDLRHLRHFVALAETLNYRQAAERLHMAQPPLSASIRSLEDHLGCVLFERSRRGTQLTSAGQAALATARRTLLDAQRFESEARDAASGLAGTLSIGYVASAAYDVLPRLIPLMHKAYPDIHLKLVEQTSERVLELVEQSSLDIGLMRTPLVQPTTASVQVFQRDPFVVALPDSARWRERDAVDLSELATEPFVFYASPYAKSLTMLACQRAGFMPQVAQEASGLPTVVSLVKCALGVALVPGVARLWPLPGVLFRPLRGIADDLAMCLAMAWLPSRESRLAQRFREVLEQAFGTEAPRER